MFHVYYSRGNAYYQLKQYKEAIQDYEKAIELNPQYSDAHVHRMATLERLAELQQTTK